MCTGRRVGLPGRGIHVDDITLVIQADAPDEYKTYLHRSGRTGRAGNNGRVVTVIACWRRESRTVFQGPLTNTVSTYVCLTIVHSVSNVARATLESSVSSRAMDVVAFGEELVAHPLALSSTVNNKH